MISFVLGGSRRSDPKTMRCDQQNPVPVPCSDLPLDQSYITLRPLYILAIFSHFHRQCLRSTSSSYSSGHASLFSYFICFRLARTPELKFILEAVPQKSSEQVKPQARQQSVRTRCFRARAAQGRSSGRSASFVLRDILGPSFLRSRATPGGREFNKKTLEKQGIGKLVPNLARHCQTVILSPPFPSFIKCISCPPVKQVPQSSQNPSNRQSKAAHIQSQSSHPSFLSFIVPFALLSFPRLSPPIISVASFLINNQFQPKRRMSTQHPSKEHPLNRREVYKNQKLQQINQIYYCECGKNYLTFSALYLHARNKHEVKLTTKRTSTNCTVHQKEEKTIVTYFVTPKTSQQAQSSPKQNQEQKRQLFARFLEVIGLYLAEEGGRRTRERKERNAVIQQFSNYFQQLQEEGVEDVPTDIEKITFFFNDFIAHYLPLAHQQKIITLYELSQSETELIRFWRWLRENNYTSSQLLHRTYPAPTVRL